MSCLSCHPPIETRRGFLRLAGFGFGLAATLPSLPALGSTAAHEAEVLLLCCMDFRLQNEIESYMEGRGLKDRYDEMILAGASLGPSSDKFPAWREAFFDHLDLAIQLHKVRKLIVLDHRDCGAYKLVFGPDSANDRAAEAALHSAQMRILAEEVARRHPQIEAELLLMSLDGSVENLAPPPA